MWLEVEYLPTSLFSFKDINATNTAATSLLFPTPFGVKMALISKAIQNYDLKEGERVFDVVKDKEIRFNLPKEAVINKTFGRITDLRNEVGRSKPAYREYVYFRGTLKIVMNLEELDEEEINLLKNLFIKINYFGKKGSFMQFKDIKVIENPGSKYTKLLGEDLKMDLNNKSIIQQAEDIPPEATFEEINIYNSEENLKRVDNEKIYEVDIEKTLSGEGYQYYKIN
ncbi:MAG: hypothetical protein ACOC4G_00280 [Bacillota bacterium]